MPEIPDHNALPDDYRRRLGPGQDLLSVAGFETLAIHSGQNFDSETGAVVPPIYAVSTYAQDSVANPRAGYVYGRGSNPTRAALEECMAALEEGTAAIAFPSGMAAEDAVFGAVCQPGDHVVIPDDVYGGTYRLLEKVFKRWDLSYTPVPISDLDRVAAAVRPGETRLIWCETPTNPLLGLADISALTALARGCGALVAVDNTFASPYLQRPIRFGADIVVHSSTKYLGGHSDVLGGVVVTRDEELGASVRFHQNATGAVPSPFDSWLILRGVKTLAVRMQRQCETASRIATRLESHPSVDKVFYPGLRSHPGHDIALKQMSGFGGIISFTLRGGEPAALKVCNTTRLFTLAESLGAVESLICHPLRMTHASAAGSSVAPPPDLVRISVGLESAGDLISDLMGALDQAK